MIAALVFAAVLAADAPPASTTTAAPAATSKTPAAGDPQALVKASQAAKAKKGQTATTRKVITNADLKKAHSTLLTLPPAPKAVGTKEAPATPTKSLLQQQDDAYRARLAAQERVTKTEGAVHDLEDELARVEQSYYDENDLNYRDTVIQKRFADTKSRLATARQALAEARAALDATAKH